MAKRSVEVDVSVAVSLVVPNVPTMDEVAAARREFASPVEVRFRYLKRMLAFCEDVAMSELVGATIDRTRTQEAGESDAR